MSDLINRLRGIYKVGEDKGDGTGEFGTRSFADFIPAISLEAANVLEQKQATIDAQAEKVKVYELVIEDIKQLKVSPSIDVGVHNFIEKALSKLKTTEGE